MCNEDRVLIIKLTEEIFQLRGEMKEFKEQTIYRLNLVEKRCEERQSEPDKCTTGRKLEEFITNGKEKSSGGRGITMLLIETCVLLVMILTVFYK